jgi:phosphate transport system substrate-binding protein
MNFTKLWFALATCGVSALAQAQAGYPEYTSGPKLTGDLRIVAESSAEPLMTLWVEGFKRVQPGVNLIVRPTSPLAAAPMVTSGAADLGFPARELWPYEEELVRKFRGYDPYVVLVGLGAHTTPGLTPALGVFVNAGNPLTRITLDQLDAIYSGARRRGFAKDIATWGDLGATGEWATRPIHALTHRMPNGIDYFIQKVVTKGADFKKSVIELPMRRGNVGPDELIAEAVAKDPAAIGFGCFGNVIPGMKTIAVGETASGPYCTGTLEEVKTLHYPLARPIYIVIDRAPGQPIAPKLEEFLRYILSAPGQNAFAASGGWLPLPAELAKAELARLK